MPTKLGIGLELGALGIALIVAIIGWRMQARRKASAAALSSSFDSPDSLPAGPPPLPAEATPHLASSPPDPDNPSIAPLAPPSAEVSATDASAPHTLLDKIPTSWIRGYDFALMALILLLYLWPIVLVFMGKHPEQPVQVELPTILSTMFMQIALTILVLGLAVWRVKPTLWLGLKWPGKRGIEWVKWLASIPICIGATWILMTVLYAIGVIPWLQDMEGGDGQQEVVKAFQQLNDPVTLICLVIMAAVVAPVTEEVLFRGYFYTMVKSKTGRTAAVIVSALVFATVHHNTVALVPLAFLATLLALSYELSGSIWMPMSIHAAFNSLTVLGQLAIKFNLIQAPPGS